MQFRANNHERRKIMDQYDNFKQVEGNPATLKKAVSLQNTIKKSTPTLRNVMEKTLERPRYSNYNVNESDYQSRNKEQNSFNQALD